MKFRYIVPLLGVLLCSACESQTELFSHNAAQEAFTWCAAFEGSKPEWIVERLPQGARLDRFTDMTPAGERTFTNVLLEKPGTTQEWIVLVSHYDLKTGIPDFKGANDGGSSTALLLALAKQLSAEKFGLLFAFVDGEECLESYSAQDGLHGSRYLAKQLATTERKVRAVMILDMIGDKNLQLEIPANVTARLTPSVLEAARRAGCEGLVRSRYSQMIDDHVPFLMAGFPVTNLIDFDYGPNNAYWHTAQDTIDKLSPDSFYKVGNIVSQWIKVLEEN